ncbi:carboxypeptidase-like regulatory domain-containing protein [Mangrovibacterium diazotrophicum]|uniref:Carboxypeptidase-like protein n=1 Tax=Mangrovibacterium diazotrophicum TaxID=1261403 RepID=A0A419W9P7_9BACT|nr:carboxypeptidase-like regulatory domain-containing protein [Mangrovibacterium diazotrophicum]RKD92177.1 carboxypeptidase-like protein [Mangrovibacterium diazotrophicum]
MKNLFLTVLMVFAISVAMAGEKKDKEAVESNASATTVLSGSVIDQLTNEALVGVKVELEGTNKVVYTDFDGNYSFEDVKPGTYNLTASYVSYEKKSMEKVSVNPNKNEMIISLKSSN